ncbi:hypothetical protein [Wolbachia endosymbiont (group B) of Limnophora tigrina]|uniref:hypothetical protein n=1 Tax=Wolbachia endosymbiont (group B) of Limnophora tigrina TaxID=3139317 RepID=UPI0035B520E1
MTSSLSSLLFLSSQYLLLSSQCPYNVIPVRDTGISFHLMRVSSQYWDDTLLNRHTAAVSQPLTSSGMTVVV